MGNSEPDKPAARVPFRLALASIIGLWATYLVLMTLRAEMLGMDHAWEMFERRLITSSLGVVITLALWIVLRLFDSRPLWTKIIAALAFAVPASLLSMQVNRVVFADLQAALDEKMLEELVQTRAGPAGEVDSAARDGISEWIALGSHEQVIEVTFSRYFMMLTWCALYLALLAGEKARLAERREQQFRTVAKAAELKSLRYQVNPHFLFNTLNSLSALVLTGKTQAAEKMIHMISTFYRRSLADDPTADVTLAEEVALQRLYLDIEAVRFPLRLVARYDIPGELEDALIPGMILQPLIENSVKHAVAPSTGQVTITLAAREEYGRLVVTVSDDGQRGGQGSGGSGATRPGFGIGLTNVRQRLEARFGKDAGLVSGLVPGGFATHLRLPLVRTSRRAAA